MAEIRLKAPKGAAKKKRIRGRGQGSGRGVRCGRGDKGQNARSGGGVRPGFEGGQMPLYRRIARRGFSNSPFKKEYAIVNVGQLENKYVNGDVVNNESLIEKGLIRKKRLGVKILGEGDISKKLKIDVAKMSQTAITKITNCGGEIIGSRSAPKGSEDAPKGSEDAPKGSGGKKSSKAAAADSKTEDIEGQVGTGEAETEQSSPADKDNNPRKQEDENGG